MPDWLNRLPRWLVLEIALPLTILNIWLLGRTFGYFQSLLIPLIIAMLLAFLLDYPVRYLQRRGLKRDFAILGIALLALLTAGAFGIVLAPVLLRQLEELTNRLPVWIQSSGQQLQAVDSWLTAQQIPLDLSALAAQLAGSLPTELQLLPDQVLVFLLGFADRLLELVLTAVLTLNFLLHGEAFWKGLLQWLPNQVGPRIQKALRQQFQNYFVGQAMIAALMGAVLTIAFGLLKIPFWLVFGLGIGVTVLIPFGDFLGITVVTLLVSLKSLWLGGEVLAVAILTDQIIDNAIAPRLLGNLVGLNPIWVLIALLLGAQLGGILGVVIAVPLTGTVKSLANSWRQSQLSEPAPLSIETEAVG
ncbi:MAG: AI-2E family transporter [Leptolyngbya sp. SIO4C1]|nr:AI-2E family transporter [Leptolyngbya sp. SIO4C1]